MELESGKTYVDGDGEKVQVLLTDPYTDFPFTGIHNHLRYMDDGRYIDHEGPMSVYNLIEEV